jgi:hypothetical protein
MNNYKSQIFVIIAVFLLVIPIFLLYLWFYACSQTNGYPDNQLLYNSYLPQFLKGRYASTLFPLPFCATAIILNIRNLHSPAKWLKFFSWIVVILGSFLAFANLWSMM